MKRRVLSDLRNIRHSQFRDNTVIHQGDAYIRLPHSPARVAIRVIPYPRNEDFINRSDIVTKLDELLPESPDYHSAALCGLGGSGKTQIALNYIYSRCGTRSVFWVHADTKATIIADYKVIADKFGISEKTKTDDEALLMAVRSRIEEEPEWLLVLDNADDLSIFGVGLASTSSNTLPNCIPKGPKGLVLWTSRDKRIMGTMVGALRAIEVGDMSLEEAKKLLEVATATTQNEATSEDIEDINKLLESLQYHALAISQASAYMRRTSTSVRKYTTMLAEKKKRHKLLKKSEFDRHRKLGAPNSILETWSISIKRIQQENEKAFNLFHIIAYFDSQRIPLRMRKPLEEFPTTISASDVAQENEGESEGKDESFFASCALRVMAYLFRDLHKEETAQVLGDEYVTHALQVAEWMELCGEEVTISNKLSDISTFLGEQDSWEGKRLLDERVLAMRRKILGEEHPDTIEGMAALAITYLGLAFEYRDSATLKFDCVERGEDAQDLCNKAEKFGEQAVQLRRKILGPKDPDTIASLKTMIDVYCRQGRWNEARETARQILTIQQEKYGDKHPTTLIAMEDLAYVYDTDGQCDEALHIREKVLETQKETVGEENIATVLAMHNLAISWSRCGRLRDAFNLMTHCDKLFEEVISPFHRIRLAGDWYIDEWRNQLSESDVQEATHESSGNDEEMTGVTIA